MNIKTRLVGTHLPEVWEAFDSDICDGKPGDIVGSGRTSTDAVRALLDKIDATVAEAEASPPVDVHVQLRDAKALLKRGLDALERVSAGTGCFRDGDQYVHKVVQFHREASLFLAEHGQ